MLDIQINLKDFAYVLTWRPHGTCHVIRPNAKWRPGVRKLSTKSRPCRLCEIPSSWCPPPRHLRQPTYNYLRVILLDAHLSGDPSGDCFLVFCCRMTHLRASLATHLLGDCHLRLLQLNYMGSNQN